MRVSTRRLPGHGCPAAIRGPSRLSGYFGAPPPTLLVFAPLTVLPEIVAVWLVIIGSFVLAGLAFRSIGMPLWWLVAWPVVDGSLVGNPDVALLAVLVLNRGRFSWLAPFLKIYGFGPLLGERRVRQIVIATAAMVLTFAILPWGTWWSELPLISQRLALVSDTSSVYGIPVLMVVAAIALLSLGLRRASWLAVPVLWPYTQPHYLTMALPALSPWLAVAWSFPHPMVVAGSVVIEAAYVIGRRTSSSQRIGATA